MTGLLHIVLARKPLEGTVAENCLQWGCGALWIDGCRIETKEDIVEDDGRRVDLKRGTCAEGYDRPNATMFRTGKPVVRSGPSNPLGRFPANLILGGEEVVIGFPITQPAGNTRATDGITAGNSIFGIGSNGTRNPKIPGDCGGSAARFFFNFSEQESDE